VSDAKHRLTPADEDEQLLKRFDGLQASMSWPWSEPWSDDEVIGQALAAEFAAKT
jgi:hypothetical protein